MNGRWTEFERVDHHWDLFDLMIRHLRLRPVELARTDSGKTFTEAVDACMRCYETVRCEAWLQRADATAGPPEFCPLRRVGRAA